MAHKITGTNIMEKTVPKWRKVGAWTWVALLVMLLILNCLSYPNQVDQSFARSNLNHAESQLRASPVNPENVVTVKSTVLYQGKGAKLVPESSKRSPTMAAFDEIYN